MYTLKTNLAHKSNYGPKRSSVQFIVVHYTGNDGDSDENNGIYFSQPNRHASAHYFVDNDSVTLSVPEEYVAWSVGGANQSNHHPFKGICTNINSISIEMCDNNRDGKIQISDATLNNTYILIRNLMKKYGIDINHVIRHYDVNGKLCPNCNGLLNDGMWNIFKQNIISTKTTQISYSNITEPVSNYSNSCVSIGQRESITYCGFKISVDGMSGPETKKNVIRCFQKAINDDYNAGLSVDGIVGPKTINALGNHYVKRGETQHLVRAVEIALNCYGYSASVEKPKGIFGPNCQIQVINYQSDRGLKADGIAGVNTIKRMMGL